MRSIEIPQPNERDWRYRCFEILPGALTYIIIALPIILGIFSPEIAAYFIIAYIVLSFIRSIGINIRSLQGYHQMQVHQKLPWESLLSDLEQLQPTTRGAPKWHARNLRRVEKYMLHTRTLPSEVYHAVLIASVNETRDILEPTVKSVLDSQFDPKKVIVIMAYEARGESGLEQVNESLVKDYGKHFYHMEAVKHPDQIPGEVKGKGGNVTFAGRRLQEFIEERGIDPLKVLVTTLDSDNRPHKKYFEALTYTYCSTEDPKHASYQPITLYSNNIWDAPAPMRVVATGNSIWNTILSMRPHLLRNFSAHSQPMAALLDTDFWSVRTVVEDGHQFWRTYFTYDSNYVVFPVFVPIYQDAVLTDKYKKTLIAQFYQVRRWAYGASDIAYVFNQGFLKKNSIPKHKVAAKLLRLTESHISWSTTPIILLLAAWPLFLFHVSNQNAVGYLANELPPISSSILRVAMVGIAITLFLSIKFLPPKPERYKRRRTVWMVLQWGFLFITPIIYGACAAINSQTRLMFGWYLGVFESTEKAVAKEDKIISGEVEGAQVQTASRLGGLRDKGLRRPKDQDSPPSHLTNP